MPIFSNLFKEKYVESMSLIDYAPTPRLTTKKMGANSDISNDSDYGQQNGLKHISNECDFHV